jgi:cytochrome c553
MRKMLGMAMPLSLTLSLGLLAAPLYAAQPKKEAAVAPVAAPAAPQSTEDKLAAMKANINAAVAAGKKASFFCANCHGEDGNSKYPEVPNLAGQNPAYLLEQIRKFGSGQRKDEFMQGLIKVLSEDERIQIALYYSESKVNPGTADAGLVRRGQDVFAKLCVRCHGEDARGSEKIARLAGQQREYLIRSITRYRDKTGERIDPLMQIATAPLTNDDIKAVTAYLTTKR